RYSAASRSSSMSRRFMSSLVYERISFASHERSSPAREELRRQALFRAHRNEYLLFVSLHEERDDFTAALLCCFLQLVDGLHGRAVHAEDDIARSHACSGSGAVHVLHEQVALRFRLLLLFRRQRPHDEAKLSGLIGAAVGGRNALAVIANLLGLDRHAPRLAVAP